MQLNFYDSNCVLGKIVKPTIATPKSDDELLEELSRVGVTRVLASHAHALQGDITTGNNDILDISRHRNYISPMWVIPQHSLLDIPVPENYVVNMLANGVRGVRVEPTSYNGYLCEEWALGPLWRKLEERRVPVFVGGSDIGKYPDQPRIGFSALNLFQISQTFPDLPLIIYKLNFSSIRVVVGLMKQCRNIYVENSYFTAHNGVEFLVEAVGASRVIFGSGMPWSPPGPAALSIAFASISKLNKELIAEKNLESLLEKVYT
jgi:hypothetical protein